jgi:hypothetical protein
MSMSAQGISHTVPSEKLLISCSDVRNKGVASAEITELKGSLLFRSTLQDAAGNRPALSVMKGESQSASELLREQERPAILSEAGSGILLAIGLPAVICIGQMKVLSRKSRRHK